jgi:hypothetical protein
VCCIHGGAHAVGQQRFNANARMVFEIIHDGSRQCSFP